MLSIAPLTGGPGYYLALASLNYYTEGGEPLPLWAGTAAREFGLAGVVDEGQLQKLCAGFDPETGERLVFNAGSPRRSGGQDLTFSCPKTVSLIWCLGDDELRKAVERAQLSAVKQALAYLEDRAAYARVGINGQSLVRCPLLAALFEHGSSRAMDPQLHTHCLVVNLTKHPDGRTTAIDPTYLYHFKMAAGAIYRAALAENLVKLGVPVEQRKLGASVGFEVPGIPDALVQEFSKRRAAIEKELELRAGSLDAASPRYAELVAKETRRAKDGEKPRMELLREWKEVGRRHGLDEVGVRRMLAPSPALSPEERDDRKERVFSEGLSALSDQHAHWNEVDLTKHVAERAPGRISARDVREVLERKFRSPELVCVGSLSTERRNKKLRRYIDRSELRYSTPGILRMERNLLGDAERVVRGPRKECPARYVEEAIEASSRRGFSLDAEQRDAVRHLVSGPSIRLMSGLAGTGKTSALKVCVEAWRAEHPKRLIWGCAVAGKAMKRLKEGVGGGVECDTLQRTLWLLDQKLLRLDSRSVVILDEAGMVGTRQLGKLVEHIKNSPGARLVLVGDSRQLQPIDAGGPFKMLSEIFGEAKLQNIRRQRQQWARGAVKSLERGNSFRAVATFIEHGRFHLAEGRPQAMAKVIARWKADGGVASPSSVLLLASLNVEVKELNLMAQAARIAAGAVDPKRAIRANGVDFHVGDRLQFQKRSKVYRFENSDCGTVTAVEPERRRVSVRLDEDGREVTVDLKRFSGDNLRLGYASSTHKAQGSSIKYVHVLVGGPLTDLHMGYVQASRGIESTDLYCDRHTAGEPRMADLIRSLGRERQKTMAHEVLRQAERGRAVPVGAGRQGEGAGSGRLQQSHQGVSPYEGAGLLRAPLPLRPLRGRPSGRPPHP